jgi:hypothetical protein
MKPWDNKPLFPICAPEEPEEERRPTASDYFEVLEEAEAVGVRLLKPRRKKKQKTEEVRENVYVDGVPYKLLRWKLEPYGTQANSAFLTPDSREVPTFKRTSRTFLIGESRAEVATEIIEDLNRRIGLKGLRLKNRRYFMNRDSSQSWRILPNHQDYDDFIPLSSIKCVDSAQCEEAALLEKTREFSRRLAEDPSNTYLWLDLVNFQDSIAMSSSQRIEKQLSILTKALESGELTNPTPLRVKYAQLGGNCLEIASPDVRRSAALRELASKHRKGKAKFASLVFEEELDDEY